MSQGFLLTGVEKVNLIAMFRKEKRHHCAHAAYTEHTKLKLLGPEETT